MGTIILRCNLVMDCHPIQGGVAIFLVASDATETGVKRRPDGPLGRCKQTTTF